MPMTQREALEVVAGHRGDRVVVTTMTAVAIWPQLADSPLDFHYIPSAMGHGPALGLGIALAQPGRGVIVLNGDGCTLMSLGCLVTLAANPADVYLVILDNALYEVTGGQATAGAGRVAFAALARAAGIPRVYAFDSLDAWRAGAAEALTGPGPVAVWLKVEGRLGQKTPKAPRPMAEQIARLQQALGVQSSRVASRGPGAGDLTHGT
ncbi:MAG: thiamine pyrophosphate-binding protein [Gemmataceae bacterium]|nr:thiamine pyrophosphate-binding protein [Gemmataceae bacterium]